MKRKTASPECPAWLEGLARAEWERLVRERVVVPTEDNYTHMMAYCQSYSRWRAAEEVLNAEGTELIVRDDKGVVKAALHSPQIGISMKYFDRMLKSALTLGINTDRPGVAKHTKGPRPSEPAETSFFGSIPAVN